MKTKYKIEKGIPVPKKYKHWSRFPFEKMNVGDSFLVTCKQEEKTSCNSLKGTIYQQSRKFCIDTFSPFKFCFEVNRQEKTVRVFRIE